MLPWRIHRPGKYLPRLELERHCPGAAPESKLQACSAEMQELMEGISVLHRLFLPKHKHRGHIRGITEVPAAP